MNRAATQFMRAKFEGWYADRIIAQKDSGQDIQPVDLRLSVVKPIGAQWVIGLYVTGPAKTGHICTNYTCS